jgi:hypothetical protein
VCVALYGSVSPSNASEYAKACPRMSWKLSRLEGLSVAYDSAAFMAIALSSLFVRRLPSA